MYCFAPMLPIYRKLAGAPSEFLASRDGRRLIAKSIKLCRAKYGRAEAIRFRNAMTVASAVMV